MIRDLNQVHDFFCQTFPNSDSTWAYKFYNVFNERSVHYGMIFARIKNLH